MPYKDPEKQRQWVINNHEKVLAAQHTYYDKHPEKCREKVRKAAKKRRSALQDIKKAKGCARCGVDDVRVLDFHHRNPSEKKFNLKTTGTSMAGALEEAAKCDVLCANCHKIVEYEKRNL